MSEKTTRAHLESLGRVALASNRVIVLMLGLVERLCALVLVLDRFVQRVLGFIRRLHYRQNTDRTKEVQDGRDGAGGRYIP